MRINEGNTISTVFLTASDFHREWVQRGEREEESIIAREAVSSVAQGKGHPVVCFPGQILSSIYAQNIADLRDCPLTLAT